jgi:hypothetical protein
VSERQRSRHTLYPTHVSVNLTPEDAVALKMASEEAGVSQSAYLRMLLRQDLRGRVMAQARMRREMGAGE